MSRHRGPVGGNIDGGTFTRDFERQVRFCFIRSPFYWEFRVIRKRRLWNRAALSIGALLGNLEGPRERVKWGSGNGVSLSIGKCREGSFAVALKDM
jgi:hypothetical protein